jgi:eukaryotic-like serine/threonine-protein kinase
MATGRPNDQSTLLWPQATVGNRDAKSGPCILTRCQATADPNAVVASATRFGGYELLEEIGRGSMGIVYKARQIGLNRLVALKTPFPGKLRQEPAIEQFLVEAQLAAQFDHPGIIPVHDAGRHNGRPYFCMALIDGESLAARLTRGPLALQEVVQIVADAADAVQHFHDRGVIHRDLKPANILLDGAGRPRIADFGLARRLDDAFEDAPVIAGTPSYMSPEQASGQITRIGPASDIYSLGAVLYHCLAGRPPFEGTDSLSVIRQVCEEEPPSLRSIESSIPQGLDEIALCCMHKDPACRYASAAALGFQLRQIDR